MTNLGTTSKTLIKSKTFWTGVIGLLTAGAGAATGEMSIGQAVQTGITCLIGIFLRNGMINP